MRSSGSSGPSRRAKLVVPRDTYVAIIDFQKLLALLAGTTDPHAVSASYDLLGNGVVTYLATGRSASLIIACEVHFVRQDRFRSDGNLVFLRAGFSRV